MTTQRNLCRHCGGTGTCQSEDLLCSCTDCIGFYQKQIENSAGLHLVPCSHCHGTGKSGGGEGFLLCSHCDGGGYCRPYGEQVGCDYCLESYAAAHPERNTDESLIQVVCAACGGKGYVPTPAHLVTETAAGNRPPLDLFRVVMAFLITFVVAMIGSLFVVWAVQSNAKNLIKAGNIEEAIRYDSYMTLNKDRTMTIEEIVILKSISQKDFMVKRVYPALKNSFFNREQSDMALQEIYLDGVSMKFKAENIGKTFVIRVPGKIIEPGIHTYAFIYKIRHPVLQSHGESVFKWVITGGQWGFPAKQTTVALALPKSIDKQSLDVDGGVGPVFWFKRECISSVDDSGNVTFSAGQPMTKLDRLNVKVTW